MFVECYPASGPHATPNLVRRRPRLEYSKHLTKMQGVRDRNSRYVRERGIIHINSAWVISMRILLRLLISGFALVSLARCGSPYSNVANLQSSGSTIVCFGDSLTRGYGATPTHDYPSVMAAELGREVINAGRDGDTTESALARLASDVLSNSPRLVVVALGGNDTLQQRPKAATMQDLDLIVSRIVSLGAMVVLVHAKFGLLDDPYRDGIESIADKYGAVVVTGVLDGILGRPSRMYDQIHPNDAGYALMAARISAVVAPLLEAADAARAEEV